MLKGKGEEVVGGKEKRLEAGGGGGEGCRLTWSWFRVDTELS